MLRSTSPANVRPVSNRLTLIATIVLSTLALAACGGGGGGGSSPPPSSPANPPPPPPPPPANTAPTVNAGADQTITLPTNAVDLAGSATDAESNSLTYAWTASPASGVAFATGTAAATRVTFTDAGTYTLTLTANDGTADGTDTVVVTVNAAPAPPPVVLSWPGPDVETDPNHGWTEVAPADVGMDSARLQEAATYAQTGGGSGMITRHGKLVFKWTDTSPVLDADDIDIDQPVDLNSATKSVGGIALALAIDDGLVKLTDLVKTAVPQISTVPSIDQAGQDAMTVLNLATHTAGLEKKSNDPAFLYGPVGTKWVYSDGGLNWLSKLLTVRFNKDINQVLTERVWTPLQIGSDDLKWSAEKVDANGLRYRELNGGIVANANALSRVGLLYLRKGMWKDQRIISEASVELATKPRAETAAAAVQFPNDFADANVNYAVLWWTNATQKKLPNVPADAYWGWGKGDSLLVVIPSLDIVAVRVGLKPNEQGLNMRGIWNGDYSVLDGFLTPIAQSVTNPAL
jgi:CubicO group peptidase (beta-lactamase class C family)